MSDVLRRVIGQKHWRTATLEARGAPEDRLVELSFSSEAAIPRWFGNEILDHSPGAVRMDRLAAGAPLLVAHDPGDQVGVVQRAWIDSKQKRGRATVRFGRSARAEEILQDVRDGIRTTVSVGYWVHHMVLDEQTKGEEATYRVDDWEPLEISLAPVAADIAVGVGRSMEDARMPDRIEVTDGPAVAAERNRCVAIRQIGQKFDMAELAERAVADGTSLTAFRELFMRTMEERQSGFNPDRTAVAAHERQGSIPQRELRGYSLQRAVVAMLAGDWTHAGRERAISRELERQHGRPTEGLYIPMEALQRDITKAGAGGNLIGTQHLGGEYVDILRPFSAVIAAGARLLSNLVGDVQIRRGTSGSTGYWVDEAGDVTESTPAFDKLTLSPKSVGGIVEYTRKMLLQSSPEIEQLLMNDLLGMIGTAIDRVAIKGGGSNEPTGILGTAGIGSITTGGSSFGWEAACEAVGDVGGANALQGSLGWITTPAAAAQMMRTPRDAGSGTFVWGDPIADSHGSIGAFPAWMSTNVPSNLGAGTNRHAAIFGNFADVFIGQWGSIEILINPYDATGFVKGNVKIRAMADVDVELRHPESFSACMDVDPSA